MSKREIKLVSEASTQELRDFADVSLGLEVDGSENRNQILSKIAKSHFDPNAEGATIVVHKKPAPAKHGVSEGATKVVTGADGRERTYIAVTLHASDGVGGDRPVAYRVNGVTMLIPRGERSWVPEEYVEAMRNAQQTQHQFTSNGIVPMGQIPSYPFSIG